MLNKLVKVEKRYWMKIKHKRRISRKKRQFFNIMVNGQYLEEIKQFNYFDLCEI